MPPGFNTSTFFNLFAFILHFRAAKYLLYYLLLRNKLSCQLNLYINKGKTKSVIIKAKLSKFSRRSIFFHVLHQKDQALIFHLYHSESGTRYTISVTIQRMVKFIHFAVSVFIYLHPCSFLKR